MKSDDEDEDDEPLPESVEGGGGVDLFITQETGRPRHDYYCQVAIESDIS